MNPTPTLTTERLRITFLALMALLNHERLSPEDNDAIERVLTLITVRWLKARHPHQDIQP